MKKGDLVMFARLYRAHIKFPTYRILQVVPCYGKNYHNRYRLQRVDNLATVEVDPEEKLVKLSVLHINCAENVIDSIKHGKQRIEVPVSTLWDNASNYQYDLLHLYCQNSKKHILVSYEYLYGQRKVTYSPFKEHLFKFFKINGWCKISQTRLVFCFKR